MASSAKMLLLVATCVLLASMAAARIPSPGPVPVFATEFKFVCFQKIYDSNQQLVFPAYYTPPEEVTIGQGYVFNDTCTEKASPDSKEVATVSGFYVYTTNNSEHERSTFQFNHFKTKNVDFGDDSLQITGQFFSTGGVHDDLQELSIIGGTESLARAEGTLKYTKVATEEGLETYKVEGSFRTPYFGFKY